jgi:ABC-type molybdate transport system substrate-binding protein
MRSRPVQRKHKFLSPGFLFRTVLVGALALAGFFSVGRATAASVEVFHADSLAGPMQELQKAFEEKHQGVTINLTSGVSRQLADLVKPEVKFVRVTGEKDLATNRVIEFLKKASALEGKPELAQKIIDGAVLDPSKPNSVPDTVRAVKEGKANAGVVYHSAAIAAKNDLDVIRFPASVNLSDSIQNAASVPGTARNGKDAMEFVKFLLSAEGQNILKETGQPPVMPAIWKGNVPAELK